MGKTTEAPKKDKLLCGKCDRQILPKASKNGPVEGYRHVGFRGSEPVTDGHEATPKKK